MFKTTLNALDFRRILLLFCTRSEKIFFVEFHQLNLLFFGDFAQSAICGGILTIICHFYAAVVLLIANRLFLAPFFRHN